MIKNERISLSLDSCNSFPINSLIKKNFQINCMLYMQKCFYFEKFSCKILFFFSLIYGVKIIKSYFFRVLEYLIHIAI